MKIQHLKPVRIKQVIRMSFDQVGPIRLQEVIVIHIVNVALYFQNPNNLNALSNKSSQRAQTPAKAVRYPYVAHFHDLESPRGDPDDP